MTTKQDRLALRSGLEDVLGPDRTATLWSMLHDRDDLATKSDVATARDDLRDEIASVREELKGEMASLRGELKREMAELRSELNSFARTFIRVQAATVIGVGVMVVGLMQFL